MTGIFRALAMRLYLKVFLILDNLDVHKAKAVRTYHS